MNIKLKGIQSTLNKLAELDTKVTKQVDGELQAGANDMTRLAKQNAPANYAQLRNSIGNRNIGPLRYTVFATAFHAPFIEFGTVKKVNVPPELTQVAQQVKNRPKRGKWKNFVVDIYKWGRRKGIIENRDINHAYRIARKIYINGIAPQPYLWPAFLSVRPKMIQRLRDEIKRIQL